MENRNIKNFIKTNAIWLVFIIEVLIFSVASTAIHILMPMFTITNTKHILITMP